MERQDRISLDKIFLNCQRRGETPITSWIPLNQRLNIPGYKTYETLPKNNYNNKFDTFTISDETIDPDIYTLKDESINFNDLDTLGLESINDNAKTIFEESIKAHRIKVTHRRSLLQSIHSIRSDSINRDKQIDNNNNKYRQRVYRRDRSPAADQVDHLHIGMLVFVSILNMIPVGIALFILAQMFDYLAYAEPNRTELDSDQGKYIL